MWDNKGFTIIELLMVVVVIGILAAIAIPKFARAREDALEAAVVSDLKTLANQMEIYQSDSLVYPPNISALPDFTVTQGVNITITENNIGEGWAATGSHIGLAGRKNHGHQAPIAVEEGSEKRETK